MYDDQPNQNEPYDAYANSAFANLPTNPWDWEVSQPTWMLDKLIPAKSIGMLFGPSNSGKSHLMCDLVVSMVEGNEYWQGISLENGPVIVFSESHGHIQARLKAYHNRNTGALKHGLYSFPTMALNIGELQFMMQWLYQLPQAPMMIVFDTLATAFQFDENDNQEASQLVKLLETYILPALDPRGCIMIVHHTSKASGGTSARGASALIANIDWSINVQWDNDSQKTIAKWEKDRWRLVDKTPQWAGTANRIPVQFTNGEYNMMVLDWVAYDESQIELEKELARDQQVQHWQHEVKESLKQQPLPTYIHTNNRARVPTGRVPFKFPTKMPTKLRPTMAEWLQETTTTEPIFTTSGSECGFIITQI